MNEGYNECVSLKNILKLIVAIGVSELAGIIGSTALTTGDSSSGLEWYATLVKPALNPPSWLFATVWTTLFALMGIAAFLIWRKGLERRDVKIALGIFLGQLILNTLWSVIFFGLHSPGGALIEIAFLWLAILVTIVAFAKISKPAAWLLVPYIFWVSFASYLNYSIWMLN
ncbi:MAG: TspO and MBR like protein [Parcubacteria group bacterium GW2011_GWA2_51_10]|nr:MAG: TspO and MBR like protein [Parcubacteria group bacterium GW2011_GWA2_51_10]